tara:strand:- start:37 stop:492 length:456 start_codon:yes stop_codon:yes gene_type:complete
MTTYVTRVNAEGEAESIWTSGAIPSPDEGTDPNDSTKTIVHVSGDIIDLNSFISLKYYKDGVWKDRDIKPGEYYNWVNEEWVADRETLLGIVRQERNNKLFQSDWTQSADSPLTPDVKAQWLSYRNSLRSVPANIPAGASTYDEVIWPDAP